MSFFRYKPRQLAYYKILITMDTSFSGSSDTNQDSLLHAE